MSRTPMRKQVEVTLGGQTIRLRSEADEVYLKTVASYVDQKMLEIGRQTRTVTTQRLALLAAMDIADEFFRARESAQEFRRDVKQRSQRLLDMLERQPADAAVE